MELEIIQCKHWCSGTCKKGLYGGRPSPGVCNTVCPHKNTGPTRSLITTLYNKCRPNIISKTKGCGCKKKNRQEVPLYKWFGVLWIGYPYPLRPFSKRKWEGCGCIRYLKLRWNKYKKIWTIHKAEAITK